MLGQVVVVLNMFQCGCDYGDDVDGVYVVQCVFVVLIM